MLETIGAAPMIRIVRHHDAMKLSDADIQMVEKMRKQQRQLRRWRLPLLIFYSALTVAWLVLLIQVSNFPSDNITAKLLVISYTLPGIYVMLALCSVKVGLTLKYWRGDPKAELLLRVMDELQKGDA